MHSKCDQALIRKKKRKEKRTRLSNDFAESLNHFDFASHPFSLPFLYAATEAHKPANPPAKNIAERT